MTDLIHQWRIHLKRQQKIIADETPAGIVMSTENFIDAVREDMSNTKYINEINGDSGDDAHIVQKWDINKNQDDLVYEKRVIDKDDHTKDVGTMNFSASTGLDWDIPATYQDHCTINLKASLLMEHNQDGVITQKWGAVTDSVSFTIKNGEIESLSASSDKDTYKTADYTPSTSNEEYIIPEVSVSATAKNGAPIKGEIIWPIDGATTELNEYTDSSTIDTTISRQLFVDSTSDTGYHDIKVNVWVKEGYGGWTDSWSKTVEIINNGKGDDGGGGGCPYVSPYNGTKYKRDNNILVQSEFKDGEVTDYYKLDNDLAEQNGNYSLKIEEFENSEDYIDQMKLYTIDHKKGYNVGVTPDGEYLTYKDSDAPTKTNTSDGDDVLTKVNEKKDGKRLEMEAGSKITLDYGDKSFSDWKHSKLVLRNSGFSSYTDESDGFSTNAVKTSLYVKLRAGNSDWYNVTCTHPRNNPHDHVIPLEDTLHEMLKDGHKLEDMEVKIRSTLVASLQHETCSRYREEHGVPVGLKRPFPFAYQPACFTHRYHLFQPLRIDLSYNNFYPLRDHISFRMIIVSFIFIISNSC